ncbi:MAG: hypothetical protein WC988_02265 [Patescibacteria group bacterium]
MVLSRIRQLKISSIVFLFALFVLWWFHDYITKSNFSNGLFSYAYLYFLVALVGGVNGLYVAYKWGWLSSYLGKIIAFFSFGLLAQVFGQLSYTYYYAILGVEVAPYPSIGDVGYFGSVLLYICGSLLLLKLLMSNSNKKSGRGDMYLVVLSTLTMFLISYLFLLKGYAFDSSNILKGALDISYPLFQSFYVSLAVASLFLLGSRLGGTGKRGILLLLIALVIQYISDFTFLIKANNGTFYAGGPVDFLYLVAYFLMTVAIIELDLVFERLKNGKITNGGTVT